MTGMGHGISVNNPLIVSAFHRALLHQGFIVLVLAALVAIAWNVFKASQLRRAIGEGAAPARQRSLYPEPTGRRVLRVAFGLIWILDGVLQGQASMPLGMVSQVVQPTANASPSWVQHLVNSGTTIWNYHPVSAAAAAVWIQIGIGVFLMAAPRGSLSRLAGVSSAAWGVLVWVFGEAFGGVFAPGLSWMFGAPGAVLFYCVAGVLVAFPEKWWKTPRLGRTVLDGVGAFFVGMAVLQAWPGRGFWQGQPRSDLTPGGLTAMVQQMSQTPQPHPLSSLMSAFGRFDASHGWAVNLFVVVALAATGVGLLSRRGPVVRGAVIGAAVLCLADWILVQDLGFLGGVGTDPNSMIPMALVFIAGYLAWTRMPGVATAPALEPSMPAFADSTGWWDRVWADPVYSFRAVAAAAAIGVALVGVTPMAVDAANRTADPILAEVVDGTPTVTDNAAPPFNLVDQHGQAVSLESLRGQAVALTFLDPVCTVDCPTIANEFKQADSLLGSQSHHVAFVGIDANPLDLARAYLTAFDEQEGLQKIPNWRYLTGTLTQLEQVWRSYAIEVDLETGGGMVDHSDVAYVIDPSGHTRYILDTDPGPATNATTSSFAATLASDVRSALRAA